MAMPGNQISDFPLCNKSFNLSYAGTTSEDSMLDLLEPGWRRAPGPRAFPRGAAGVPGALPRPAGARCRPMPGRPAASAQAAVPARRSSSHRTAGLRSTSAAACSAPEEATACPQGAITFTADPRLAARDRATTWSRETGGAPLPSRRSRSAARRLFGRSLRLRSVAAGSCNGCEAELVALGNVVFDMARFGIQFVASPRHADGLVVTGPVSRNMRDALYKTYEAIPDPRLVIAVGACAISGGPFRGSPEVRERGTGRHAGRPVDPRVPAAPADHARRPAAAAGATGRAGCPGPKA